MNTLPSEASPASSQAPTARHVRLETSPRLRKARIQAHLLQVTQALAETLIQIEELLQDVDIQLDRLQPPFTGRIRLMWVSRTNARGYEGEKVPVPVEWRRLRSSGLWTADELPLNGLTGRQKKTREFGETYEELRPWMLAFKELLDQHKNIRGRIASFSGDSFRSLNQVTIKLKPITAMVLKEAGIDDEFSFMDDEEIGKSLVMG